MCHFLNTTIINLLSQIFVMYLTVWLHDHFLVFLSLWEHGNHLPPKLAITESSRLSFVHVLVAVRDCQVDSITNRAMLCRCYVDCRSTMSTIDDRRSTIDDRRSTIDDRRSTIDDRRSTIDDRRSTIDDRRSTIDDRRSTIDDRRSTIDDRRSTIDDRCRASSLDHPASNTILVWYCF